MSKQVIEYLTQKNKEYEELYEAEQKVVVHMILNSHEFQSALNNIVREIITEHEEFLHG